MPRRSPVMYLTTLFAASLMMTGCALRTPPAPVDTSGDARIRSDIEARIAAEPELDASEIRVEVHGRMVTLHGSVRGLAAWKCALANADLVDGVESVSDYLVILRGAREIDCLAPRPQSGTIVKRD